MEDFLDPDQILKQLDLRKDMIAVDFGSGSGGWAIPLARKLEDGMVYAVDILNEPLSALKGKIAREKIGNLSAILGNVEKKNGSTLADSSIDLVLMTNLLFQAEDKKAIFTEAKRILKTDGRILVVDWKKTANLGPEKKRITESEVKKIADELGFKVEKPSTKAKLGAGVPYRTEGSGAGEFSAGLYHWALILVK